MNRDISLALDFFECGDFDIDSMLKTLMRFSRGRKLLYVGEPGLVSDGFVNLADRFEKDGFNFE